MKTITLLTLLCILTMVSCEENEKPISTVNDLLQDHTFTSYMQTNKLILQKLNAVAGESQEERSAYFEKLKAQLNQNDGNQLYTLLGYKDEAEFIDINKIQFERLEDINSRLVDSQNKLLPEAIELSTHSLSVESIKNARSESGCKGGLPCFRTATDCDHNAEVDFGVGSATCTALGWFPPTWAVCQGTVFLVYSAEKLSCASALDKCCGLSQASQAKQGD